MNAIWPNGYKIPLIVVTGPFGSGKTSWALDVDPVLKGQGQTRTLYIDMENSAADYENQYEIDRIPLPEHMRSLATSWTPAQMWKECKRLVTEKIKTGKYSVVVFDTFSPLQDGAFESNTGKDNMDRWANVKKDIETFLTLVEANVQTVVIIVHLRSKKDNSKEKEPKGVDTFKQLASFYVYLHRDPNTQVVIGGKSYPACPKYPYPSGIILKSRLQAITDQIDEFGGHVRRPLLPDRVPVCTPAALRSLYINNKAITFSEEEQLPEVVPGMNESFTEDEKLVLNTERANAEQATAEANALAEGRKAFRTAAIAMGLKDDLAIQRAMQESGIGTYNFKQHDEQIAALEAWLTAQKA